MSRGGQQTFVYFIATEDRSMVKIGCSKCPPERLKSLACWAPQPLVILAAVPGALIDERALHERYFDLHSHHEWFRSSSQMLSDAALVARLGQLPEAFRGKAKQRNPLAVKSIRATPEWRAKVSLVHKASWAKIKHERAVQAQLVAFFAERGISAAAAHATIKGSRAPFGVRQDGSIWVSDAPRAEAFMANFAKASAA